MNETMSAANELQKFWDEFNKYGWAVTPTGDDNYLLQKRFAGENFTQEITCESPEELIDAIALASDNFDANEHASWRYGADYDLPTLYDAVDIKNRLDELYDVTKRLIHAPEHDRAVFYSAKILMQTGMYALTGSREKEKIISVDAVQENEQVQEIRNRLVEGDHVYLTAAKLDDESMPVFARFNLECRAYYVDFENREQVGEAVEIPDIYDLPVEVRRAIVMNAFLNPSEKDSVLYSDALCNEEEVEKAMGLANSDERKNKTEREPEKKRKKHRIGR